MWATIGDMAGIVVEVNARRFAVPFECPCCGAAPDTQVAIPLTVDATHPVSPETAHALDFPYCVRCGQHVARWDSTKNVETAIKVLGLLGGIALGLTVHWAAGLGTVAAAVAASVVVGRSSRAKVKATCRDSCATPEIAVAYLGWSGNASTLRFESHVYAARFAEQNDTKLANVNPVLRKVMEGHKLARLAVPTPAAAVRTVPAAATVSEWLERITSAPTRVARLDWLARALDAFGEGADRRALVEASAKLELAVVTDTEPQALQKAIIATRADNIPEELRDEIVRQLESRLA
jgi:hypothetical protein